MATAESQRRRRSCRARWQPAQRVFERVVTVRDVRQRPPGSRGQALQIHERIEQRQVRRNAVRGVRDASPAQALEATRTSLERQTREGRAGKALFEALRARIDELRARVAGLLECDVTELALTGSTTDGVNAVLAALGQR